MRDELRENAAFREATPGERPLLPFNVRLLVAGTVVVGRPVIAGDAVVTARREASPARLAAAGRKGEFPELEASCTSFSRRT